MSTELAFICNGEPVTMQIEDGETLLSVLRERLGTPDQ